MTRLMLLFIGLVLALSSACRQGGRSEDDLTDSTKLVLSGISFENDTLSEVLNEYMVLKDALVISDADEAGKAANRLFSALDRINGCENAAMIAQSIANSHDLPLQRAALSKLSDDLIPMFQHTSLNSGTIYVQHCPMFNNGEGAEWVSTEAEIKNPYYGDEMLTCGIIEAEIKPE